MTKVSMKLSRPPAVPPLFATALLACAMLAGCAPTPIRSATYVLRPQQSVDLARDLTLTYDSFSDSRCPPNARCIWAGRLVFHFVLDGPSGEEEFTLGPDQPSVAPPSLRGVRIALDPSTIPPARAGGGVRPSETALPVTVRIVAQ